MSYRIKAANFNLLKIADRALCSMVFHTFIVFTKKLNCCFPNNA